MLADHFLDQLQVLDDRRQLVRDVVGQFEALFRRELGRRLAVQDQGTQRATPATKRGDDGRSEPDGALEGECQSGGGLGGVRRDPGSVGPTRLRRGHEPQFPGPAIVEPDGGAGGPHERGCLARHRRQGFGERWTGSRRSGKRPACTPGGGVESSDRGAWAGGGGRGSFRGGREPSHSKMLKAKGKLGADYHATAGV